MPRELITKPEQTIEYYVMWGLESGLHQASHISLRLKKHNISLSEKQISGALQRLRKQGIVEYNGKWDKSIDS